MTDKEFLTWIHERLAKVHGENESVDYMHKLRAVIESTDPDHVTPNVCSFPKNSAYEWIDISSDTHACERMGEGTWFKVVAISGQNNMLIVEYVNNGGNVHVMYVHDYEFTPKSPQDKEINK